jgi:hypothetical protein
MSDDDVELGTLSYCEVCDAKTLHVGRVCQDHRVVRRRKEPVVAAAAPRPVVKRRPPPPRRIGRTLALLVIGALMVALMGTLHVIHGDRTGFTLCLKEYWRLSGTFVNSDDEHPDARLLKRCAPE